MPDADAPRVATPAIILSIDPGTQKTGVALGNRITKIARPLTTVRGGFDIQFRQLVALCDTWQPGTLLIGLPDKKVAMRAHAHSQRLADAIRGKTTANISFYDEAYTTQASRGAALGDKKHGVDAHAAALLAEDWLAQNPA